METPALESIQLVDVLKSVLAPIVKQAYEDARKEALNCPDGPENPIYIDEVSDLIHKSRSTIYIWHSQGKIPKDVCVKHGRKLYFYRSALLEWIKAGNQ